MNIDIDARGRVWVLEGVNYRRPAARKIEDIRLNGDRITILEDTDPGTARPIRRQGVRSEHGLALAAGHRRARRQGHRLAVART